VTTENNLADRLLPASEAAHFLGYTEGTLRNKASAGEVPSVKLPSGALRFRLSELEAWIATARPDSNGEAA